MLGVTIKLRINSGTNDAFEIAFKQAQTVVAANEPGNLIYQLFRVGNTADTYLILEMYHSDEAINVYSNPRHRSRLVAWIIPFLAASPEIDYISATT